jgi:hypothetical protein
MQGDFFKEIRVKADCYVMKSILHDWTDECCVKILTNLKATMMPGSILVNFDRLMPDYDNCTPGAPHPAKAMDMNMMVRADLHMYVLRIELRPNLQRHSVCTCTANAAAA